MTPGEAFAFFVCFGVPGKTRTDFVQRPAAVKFENIFRISEVRVKGVKIAIKP